MEIIYVNDQIRLRPLIESDLFYALAWYADPVVIAGTISPDRLEPCSENMVRSMYNDLKIRGKLFIIEYKKGDWIPIGDVTLAIDTLPIVIGDSRYRGKGIAKLVIKHLLKYAQSYAWEKITLKEIYKSNIFSQKLYQSCGFKLISENENSFTYEIVLN